MGSLKSVAKKKDIAPGTGILVTVDGKEIAVFNSNGSFYAIDNACTHVGGSLSEGPLEGNAVVCPWHGAMFDLTNGQVLNGPASEGVCCYQVKVEGEDIQIEVSA